MQVRFFFPLFMLALGAAAGLPASASAPERQLPLQVTRMEVPAVRPVAATQRTGPTELRDVVAGGERLTVRAYRETGAAGAFVVDANALAGPLQGHFDLAGPLIRFHSGEDRTMRVLDMRKGEIREEDWVAGKLINLPRRQTASYWLEPEALAALTAHRFSRDVDGTLVFEPVPNGRPPSGSETEANPKIAERVARPRSAPVPVKRRGAFQRVSYVPGSPSDPAAPKPSGMREAASAPRPLQWRPAPITVGPASPVIFEAGKTEAAMTAVEGDWRDTTSWQIQFDTAAPARSRPDEPFQSRPELLKAAYDLSSTPDAVEQSAAPREARAGVASRAPAQLAPSAEAVIPSAPDWPALQEARRVSRIIAQPSGRQLQRHNREISAFNPPRPMVQVAAPGPESDVDRTKVRASLWGGQLSDASLGRGVVPVPTLRTKQRGAYRAFSGTLFIDRDADGRSSSGDQRLEGERLLLIDETSGEVIEARTAAFGRFAFEGVAAGDYRLRVMIGWQEHSLPVSVLAGREELNLAVAIPPGVIGAGSVDSGFLHIRKKPG